MELGTATSNPPKISEMFQKFAVSFKAKAFELFAEEDEEEEASSAAAYAAVPSAVSDAEDGFTLLDSAEDFIPDQKVIIIKPDLNGHSPAALVQPFDTHFGNYLISSAFALISSFEASYLQLQTAHVPFDEEGIMVNDKALVSQLQKLYDLRGLYIDSRKNPNFDHDSTTGSCLEAQVNENQNKLRALETMFNRLLSDVDAKDEEAVILRKKLGEIDRCNSKLSMRLSKNLKPPSGFSMTVRVFESMLRNSCRLSHQFTKLLIELMKRAGWDLDLAVNHVHPNVQYVKTGHNRYAFLSYICLGMFQGFDSENFGLVGDETYFDDEKSDPLMELFEHVSVSPVEALNNYPGSPFSRYCETKYEQLVHPTMESSIFKNLERKEVVLDSWRSLGVFYEAFVSMSSSIWLLHKLARSFSPMVEIFQVEKGTDFSMVYMEDVTRKATYHGKSRPTVGFTVVPGFKIGRTIIQSQVYLTGLKE